MHAVVAEPVSAIQPLNQFLPTRLPQRRVDLRLLKSEHARQCLDPGAVAETGKLLQCMLRFSRQAT